MSLKRKKSQCGSNKKKKCIERPPTPLYKPTPDEILKRSYPVQKDIEWSINETNHQLSCPICLRVMERPTIIMECLHRFCEKCINMALRTGKKECPSCRTKCPAHRHLRYDKPFDEFIKVIYPDRTMSDVDLKLKQKNSQRAFSQSFKFAKKKQDLSLKKAGKAIKPRADLLGNSSTISSPEVRTSPNVVPTEYPSNNRPGRKPKKIQNRTKSRRTGIELKRCFRPSDETIGFILRKHPKSENQPHIKKPFFRTCRETTVRHLQKLITVILNRTEETECTPNQISIYLGNREWYVDNQFMFLPGKPGIGKTLNPTQQLDQIYNKRWTSESIIDLVYNIDL